MSLRNLIQTCCPLREVAPADTHTASYVIHHCTPTGHLRGDWQLPPLSSCAALMPLIHMKLFNILCSLRTRLLLERLSHPYCTPSRKAILCGKIFQILWGPVWCRPLLWSKGLYHHSAIKTWSAHVLCDSGWKTGHGLFSMSSGKEWKVFFNYFFAMELVCNLLRESSILIK
jgi:hypothetical protein